MTVKKTYCFLAEFEVEYPYETLEDERITLRSIDSGNLMGEMGKKFSELLMQGGDARISRTRVRIGYADRPDFKPALSLELVD